MNRRGTSLPLLLLGVATAVGVAPLLPSPGGDGLAWLTIPIAFAAIWAMFQFTASREGGGPRTVPMFGVGLLVTASWQRSAFLAVWAVVIGGIGVLEGFFGVTNRLPPSLWATWEHPVIYLLLALLTVLAGMAAWLRENRAVWPGR